jgi:hypothetical protein
MSSVVENLELPRSIDENHVGGLSVRGDCVATVLTGPSIFFGKYNLAVKHARR